VPAAAIKAEEVRVYLHHCALAFRRLVVVYYQNFCIQLRQFRMHCCAEVNADYFLLTPFCELRNLQLAQLAQRAHPVFFSEAAQAEQHYRG